MTTRQAWKQMGTIMGAGFLASVLLVVLCAFAQGARPAVAHAAPAPAATPTGPVCSTSRGTFTVACKDLVRAKLLSPASAEFPGMFSGEARPSTAADCSMQWTSFVDAKNGFGVPVRRTFTCTYTPVGDTVRVVLQ